MPDLLNAITLHSTSGNGFSTQVKVCNQDCSSPDTSFSLSLSSGNRNGGLCPILSAKDFVIRVVWDFGMSGRQQSYLRNGILDNRRTISEKSLEGGLGETQFKKPVYRSERFPPERVYQQIIS